jgi:hypothetical protein
MMRNNRRYQAEKMNKLLIRMEIPFLAYSDANSDSAMIFHRWLPLKEEEFLVIEDKELRLKLWFDIKATWWASQPDESEISKWANVMAHKVYADVIVSGLSEGFLQFIYTRNYSEKIKSEDEEYQKEYEQWGERIQAFTLYYLNRLIAYVRAHKGQYWLQEYPTDNDYSAKFASKARINEGDWFLWNPFHSHTFNVVVSENYARYIVEPDWNSAKEFVRSSHKTQLHWHLLAGAEALASKNNNRAALTEAVTALEVAVNSFAANPNVSLLFGKELAERMGTERLDKQVDHMGLTGTIHYLFPILFREDQIPSAVLTACQEALEIRGNVVHSGQREIDGEKLTEFLTGIRQLCEMLENFKLGS